MIKPESCVAMPVGVVDTLGKVLRGLLTQNFNKIDLHVSFAMVQLPDAIDSRQSPSSRRHVEPPHLWKAAIAGSVGAHLLLLAFTVPLLMKVATPQSGSVPVPIELVDLNATGASASDSAQTPDGTVITPSGEQLRTAAPNTTQVSPGQSLSTEPTESTTSTDSASVLPDSTTESPQSSTGDPSRAVDDSSSQDTPPTPSSSSESGNSPNGNPSEGANQNSPTPSGQTTPTQPPNNIGNSQPTTGSASEGSNLPGVPVSQNVVPASLTASVTYSSIPASENPRDLPDENAVPLMQSQEFISDPAQSACTVTPDVIRYLGQPVAMQVEIDPQGRVTQTFLQQLSPDSQLPDSQEYTDLAQCLIKTWQFKPAISGGQPVYSDNLIVSLTISQ